MELQDEKRPCTCGCDCSCECHDNVSDKTSVSTSILGSVNNSDDLYVSTPSETKWVFVKKKETNEIRDAVLDAMNKESESYYNKVREQNNKLCEME